MCNEKERLPSHGATEHWLGQRKHRIKNDTQSTQHPSQKIDIIRISQFLNNSFLDGVYFTMNAMSDFISSFLSVNVN